MIWLWIGVALLFVQLVRRTVIVAVRAHSMSNFVPIAGGRYIDNSHKALLRDIVDKEVSKHIARLVPSWRLSIDALKYETDQICAYAQTDPRIAELDYVDVGTLKFLDHRLEGYTLQMALVGLSELVELNECDRLLSDILEKTGWTRHTRFRTPLRAHYLTLEKKWWDNVEASYVIRYQPATRPGFLSVLEAKLVQEAALFECGALLVAWAGPTLLGRLTARSLGVTVLDRNYLRSIATPTW